jgi:hypothetical protein
MTGFETYDIAAWMVDGLSKHPTVTPQGVRGVPRRGSIARLLLPMVTVGALAILAATPVAQLFVETPVRIERAAMQKDFVPDRPALFWTNAVAALRLAPLVEESGPADPPTRY